LGNHLLQIEIVNFKNQDKIIFTIFTKSLNYGMERNEENHYLFGASSADMSTLVQPIPLALVEGTGESIQ
jgi:hypothetical protein